MENNKPIKELAAQARGQLIGKYSVAILVTVSIGVIKLVIMSLADSVSGDGIGPYLIRLIVSAIIDLLIGILVLGQKRFYLKLVRGNSPLEVKDIFYGTKNSTDKAILIQAVFTISSLIASIPAILINVGFFVIPDSSYRKVGLMLIALDWIVLFAVRLFFGLSFYILNDRPQLSAFECLSESVRLMGKRKGRFVLICLSSIPLLIISFMAIGVGAFWFYAYFETLTANFYLEAIGETPAKAFTEPDTTADCQSEHYSI